MSLFSLKFMIFLAVLLLLFYLVPKKYQWVVLLGFSMLFYYLSGGLRAGVFITVTIVTTYCGGLWMDRIGEQQKARQAAAAEDHALSRDEKKAFKAETARLKKRVLLLVLLLNFGILAVVKYGNFVTSMSVTTSDSFHWLVPAILFLKVS